MWSLLPRFARSKQKAIRPRGERPRRAAARVVRRLESLEDRRLLAVITVDDDLAQKPNADFNTISAAVAAASPGDTIRVYRGTYNESVVVDKTLNLQGDKRRSVVDPPDGSPGFSLEADRVILQGFTVEGATDNAGVYTSPDFSGYKIVNNLLRDNTFGLYLNSSGARESVVGGNTFENNNEPGAASGNGIYADQGTQKVRIDGNLFRGHINAAILFADAGTTQSDVKITRNQSVNDATFAALFHGERFSIDFNLIRDTDGADNAAQGSKVFVGGDTSDVQVRKNAILGGGFDTGGFDGVAVRDAAANVQVFDNYITGVDRDGISVTATGAVQVKSNVVNDVGRNGILLSGATGAVVQGNVLLHNGQDGISLENADNNTIRHNVSERNGRDGIRVDVDSAGNTITDNRTAKNVEHDCHDDSVGALTAGTANTWLRNRGKTQNRPGLCRP